MGTTGARVAVVVDKLHDYQLPIVEGVHERMSAAGTSVLVVVSHPHDESGDELLLRLVRGRRVLGLIATARAMGHDRQRRLAQLLTRMPHLPLVTTGEQMAGHPFVRCDNAAAAAQVVAHVLDECGRRRPVFFAGPADNLDSLERQSAFLATTAERGLVGASAPLVVGAGYDRGMAFREMSRLLRAGTPVDAVVAANDDMAIGVLDAVAAHGLRVPQDVVVTGFDDSRAAARTDPPLTTVDQQLRGQGELAAELLLAQIAGAPLPPSTPLPTRLLVRGSSGAGGGAPAPTGAAAEPPAPRTAAGPGVPALVAAVLADIAHAGLRTDGDSPAARRSRDLVGAACAAVLSPAVLSPDVVDPAERALRAGLAAAVAADPEPTSWRRSLAVVGTALLRHAPRGAPRQRATALWQRCEVLAEQVLAQTHQARDRADAASLDDIVEMNRALSGARSMVELAEELDAQLPRLGISRCFLVLFEGPQPLEQARLAYSFRDRHGHVAPDSDPFRAEELLPPEFAAELDTGLLVLQPLFVGEQAQGLLLYEQGSSSGYTGEALRLDVSRAVDVIARAGQAAERAAELERLVAERTSQLEAEVAGRRAAQEDLRRANEELQRALRHDGLTGLYNRPALDDLLRQEWAAHQRAGEPLSVLMCDVDLFKSYNDTYGHLGGDECLRRVAACVRAAAARPSDVAARFGGEEFVVVLPRTDAAGAARVATRLVEGLRALAMPHAGSTVSDRVSMSVGTATAVPERDGRPEDLVAAADSALYRAKVGGRDAVVTASA